MVDIRGTNVAAPVVPFTTDDTYASHISTYGKGGWREVTTIEERDNIPGARRTLGMAVFVTDTKQLFILQDSLENAGWKLFSSGGGGTSVDVPEWALQPNKPTYTANEITTTTSNVQTELTTIKTNLESNKQEVDTKLANKVEFSGVIPQVLITDIEEVVRTADTNTAKINLGVKQPDGTYNTENQQGNLTLLSADTENAGLMSASDKIKLNNAIQNSDLPTKVSDLENDLQYTTKEYVDSKPQMVWNPI